MSELIKLTDEIKNIFKEVCEYTEDKCELELKSSDPIQLVMSVFQKLEDCKTEKCLENKDEIIEKLEKFIKSKE